MYEMQGPRPAASAGLPISQRPCAVQPTAGARHHARGAGLADSRCAPGVTPRLVSAFSGVEHFYCPG